MHSVNFNLSSSHIKRIAHAVIASLVLLLVSGCGIDFPLHRCPLLFAIDDSDVVTYKGKTVRLLKLEGLCEPYAGQDVTQRTVMRLFAKLELVPTAQSRSSGSGTTNSAEPEGRFGVVISVVEGIDPLLHGSELSLVSKGFVDLESVFERLLVEPVQSITIPLRDELFPEHRIHIVDESRFFEQTTLLVGLTSQF